MNLKPCPYRFVDDEGHLLCDEIKSGDREISAAVCQVCPIAAIDCVHLRATLDHQTRPPLTVRYGNGKTEVWDDLAPELSLQRGACSVKVTAVRTPHDCAGCAIRQGLSTGLSGTTATAGIKSARRRAAANPATPAVLTPARTAPGSVARKVILLQEWLTRRDRAREEEERAYESNGARPARVLAEEKRVGWTD